MTLISETFPPNEIKLLQALSIDNGELSNQRVTLWQVGLWEGKRSRRWGAWILSQHGLSCCHFVKKTNKHPHIEKNISFLPYSVYIVSCALMADGIFLEPSTRQEISWQIICPERGHCDQAVTTTTIPIMCVFPPTKYLYTATHLIFRIIHTIISLFYR